MSNLDYKIIGNGRTVLFLHGFLGSSDDWEEIANELNVRAILVDLPGHGASIGLTDEEMQHENILTSLVEIIKEECSEPCDIVSYSMGARYAFGLLCKYPSSVGKVVIESGTPGIEDEAERTERRNADALLAEQIRSEDFKEFLDSWYKMDLWGDIRSHENFNKMFETRALNNQKVIARSLEIMGTGNQDSYWSKIADIENDVLFITGSKDLKYSEIGRKVSEINKKIDFIILADKAHNVHFEDQNSFIKIVKDFLGE